MKLKYIGKGDFIPGVPARDLSDEEVQKYGEINLLSSGIYVSDREIPHKVFESRSKKTWRE